jgi:hypothetical protein
MIVKSEKLPAWVAGTLAGIIYFLTSAPTITWIHESQDSGELAACAATLGIPHPTGYPLYILAGWATIRILGWLDPGRVMVLLSVICGAFTVGIIARLCSNAIRIFGEADGNRGINAGWLGFIAAIVCAINPVMWSQAVVCEVYSPALLLQAIVWLLLLNYIYERKNSDNKQVKTNRIIMGLGLVLGLILAHHIAGIAVIIPLLIILIFYPVGNLWEYIRGILIFIAAIIILYLYLPVRSLADPAIDWGNPETLGNFIRHVTAHQYSENVFGVTWGDFVERLSNPQWIGNWGVLFVVFALAGFIRMAFSEDKRARWSISTAVVLYMIWSIIFAFGYKASDYEVFTYPLICPMAMLISVGISWVIERVCKIHRSLVWVIILVLAAFIGLGVNERWLTMDASDPAINAAANFASREIPLLPENAIVITNSDGQLFSLMYGTTVGINDPFSGEKIGPRSDIDVLTPYWLTTEWFYQNNEDSDLRMDRWRADNFMDYSQVISEFIEMNIPYRPIFIDGVVLDIVRNVNDEIKVEGGTALMRVLPGG